MTTGRINQVTTLADEKLAY